MDNRQAFCRNGEIMRQTLPERGTDRFLNAVQAAALFYELADEPEIPFYAPLGCVERAQDMIDRIKAKYPEMGLERVAVSAAPRKAPYIPANLPMISQTAGWWFHVAPLVPVMDENGEISPLVFDPALFDGPVNITQWKKRIGAAGREIARAPACSDIAMPGVDKPQDFSVRKGMVGVVYENMRSRFGEASSRGVERSQFLQRLFNKKNTAVKLPRQGKIWHTIHKVR